VKGVKGIALAQYIEERCRGEGKEKRCGKKENKRKV
jgi:hypothetical protein